MKILLTIIFSRIFNDSPCGLLTVLMKMWFINGTDEKELELAATLVDGSMG